MVKLDFFGPNARVHHVGMAVRSIDEAVPGIAKVKDPLQRVSVGFVDFSGLTIELIEPIGDKSPIDNNLKRGNKLLHLCIEVPSIKRAMEHCLKHGFRRISKREPAVAFDMRMIIWVFSPVFGLVELFETNNNS